MPLTLSPALPRRWSVGLMTRHTSQPGTPQHKPDAAGKASQAATQFNGVNMDDDAIETIGRLLIAAGLLCLLLVVVL